MTAPEIRNLLVLPTLAFLAAIVALETSGADLQIADWLYRLQGGSWRLQDAWITNNLIHDQGRNLVGIVLLALLLAIALAFVMAPLRAYRGDLIYVLVTALIAVAIVNILKETTHVDCPWDLTRYGGDKLYASLFEGVPANQEPGHCFPAGHASGAYCWLGLFFFARRRFPARQWQVLTGVMATGLVFGVAQQLRGAHFVSHDLWTIYLCWMIAALGRLVLDRFARDGLARAGL
ncbi:MAG: phosphatase PAP2 family protein [Gammaproteobacteria bacterium]|nr:phosphatase PAP2 family protein [Gammaproteobacteria bacterium]